MDEDKKKERTSSPRWQRDLRVQGSVALLFALLCFIGRPALAPIATAAGFTSSRLPLSLDSLLAAATFAIKSPPGNMSITLIDIDDALFASWGRPCLTPRPAIVSLINAVAARKPAAIVLDVGLACTSAEDVCASAESCALQTFLRGYAGAPLVLVREMHLEEGRGGTPSRVFLDRSPFEEAVAGNPHISWAHTFFLTDTDGTLRDWQSWWEACTESGTEVVPAVPLRLLAVMRSPAGVTAAPEPPQSRKDCSLSGQTAPHHRLLLGDRIRGVPAGDAGEHAPRNIPARLLLDSRYAIDAQGYYSLEGRVAVIGASHGTSGDKWRTVRGYLPGFEVIANTIRFAGGQLREDLPSATWRQRFQRLALFALLVAISFTLRPMLATILILWMAVSIAVLSVMEFGWLDIFESMELAAWFFVGYGLVLKAIDVLEEIKPYRLRRMARLALADRFREEDPECKPGD